MGTSGEIVKIGIWGPPGSGKTHFLVSQQFADREGWNIRPNNELAGILFNEGRNLLRNKLEFIPATDPDNTTNIFLPFEFEGPGKRFFQRRRDFQVLLPECAGEYYKNPKELPDLIDEISRCHGIIWIIDPEQIDNSHYSNTKDYIYMIQEWLQLIHVKQGGGRLKHYMAFCLTKMDLPKYASHLDENIEEFCLEKLGDDIRILLDDYCDPRKVEFFAISSIGFEQGTRNSNANLEMDPEKSDLKTPVNPINVFAPFAWLFNVL